MNLIKAFLPSYHFMTIAPGEKRRVVTTFYKGMPSPNPSGRPPQVWRPPHERAEFLTLKYRTDQLISFAKQIAAGKRSPLSGQDAIVCVHLANILQMRDGPERERLYDRYFGKVPDRTINLNLNLDATPQQLSERALALLNKIAPRDTVLIPAPETIENQVDDDSPIEAGISAADYDDLVEE